MSDIVYDLHETPFGTVRIVLFGDALIEIAFEDPVVSSPVLSRPAVRDPFAAAPVRGWLDAYCLGACNPNDLPRLTAAGCPIDAAVRTALLALAPGCTITYSDLAARIGRPSAVRAVASACARNRIAVLVPCHRVVPKAGGVGGYRWGVERKKALLRHERDVTSRPRSD